MLIFNRAFLAVDEYYIPHVASLDDPNKDLPIGAALGPSAPRWIVAEGLV